MSEIIYNTVDLIRPDCVITCQGSTVTSSQIENQKNYLKQKINTVFDNKVQGKTVIVWSNNFTLILPAIKAIWELGCSVAVHDINVGYTTHPEFKQFYDFIDLIICENQESVTTSFPDKAVIDILKYDPLTEYHVDTTKVQNLDVIAVKTHSSGTTGTPKIIDITHRDSIQVVKNNIDLLKFSSQDRVIHYKTLHHGSLFLNYAIPSMATCSQHFWVKNNVGSGEPFLNYVFQFIIANKITKFLIPYNWVRYLPKVNSVDLSQLSLITVQGPTNSEMIEIFRRFSPKEVINNFGCTEIGTMFVSITNQSNLEHYNPNKFEYVMPQLEYKIHSNFLQVRYPNNSWQILADCFEQQHQILWWRGRAVHIIVDHQSVDFSVLKPMLEQQYNTIDFSVVPDFEKNKLYLAVYDNKIPVDLDAVNKVIIEKLDKKLRLSQISFVKTQDVMFGMKPSAPLLLYMFRDKEK